LLESGARLKNRDEKSLLATYLKYIESGRSLRLSRTSEVRYWRTKSLPKNVPQVGFPRLGPNAHLDDQINRHQRA
jgi:hypothetical protein